MARRPRRQLRAPKPLGFPPGTRLWHTWPGRNRPATAAEEAVFVDGLRERARKRPGRFERSDVTAVLNALRCGLSADELFERAPGLDAGKLLRAWTHLEDRRSTSAAAWASIVALGGPEGLDAHAGDASLLVPVLVRDLQVAATSSPAAFASRVERCVVAVDRAWRAADEIESMLPTLPDGTMAASEAGTRLYNPYSPTIWGEPAFVARRVGELMPLRVADLLGDRAIAA